MSDASRFAVSAAVSFPFRGGTVDGHIAAKQRRLAVVVDADEQEYRVPWHMLSHREGAEPRRVATRSDKLKADFRPEDKVAFEYSSEVLRGVIVRLGPKRAVVACGAGREFRVPYAALQAVSPQAGRNDEQRLAEVAAEAERLIALHGLAGWSVQFDDASRRAGRCSYETRVIGLTRLYCLTVPADEVRNTILHEIAHALVGPEHNHDAVWKARARAIGCTGERCHDVEFALPRYIVSCPRCGWAQGANARRRAARCKTCRRAVAYKAFTREAWDRAAAQGRR